VSSPLSGEGRAHKLFPPPLPITLGDSSKGHGISVESISYGEASPSISTPTLASPQLHTHSQRHDYGQITPPDPTQNRWKYAYSTPPVPAPYRLDYGASTPPVPAATLLSKTQPALPAPHPARSINYIIVKMHIPFAT
jgi:hypothetical protein